MSETDSTQQAGRSVLTVEQLLNAADVHPSATIHEVSFNMDGELVIDWSRPADER